MPKIFIFLLLTGLIKPGLAAAAEKRLPATNNIHFENAYAFSLQYHSDTVRHKDSAKKNGLISNDPKYGFKDLFVANTIKNGFNAAQLNPRAIDFVQDYMEKNGKNLQKMKDWGRPYFDLIQSILEQHGVPGEMKYLAVIESHLKTYAISWAGAVGPWQFMPLTARQNGLRVDMLVDERTDYYKSTHAAAHYLTMLYNTYRDWLLVIAAYNGGAGNVNAAIRKSGSRNFWDLQYYLPAESRDHVKKFIATHYIMEGKGSITTATKDEAGYYLLNSPQSGSLTSAELANSKVQTISGKYNSAVISKYVLMDLNVFNRYNPDFDRKIADEGTYEIRLPANKMDVFLDNKFQILNESLQSLLNPVNNVKPVAGSKTMR